jgi:hypothetical protein
MRSCISLDGMRVFVANNFLQPTAIAMTTAPQGDQLSDGPSAYWPLD